MLACSDSLYASFHAARYITGSASTAPSRTRCLGPSGDGLGGRTGTCGRQTGQTPNEETLFIMDAPSLTKLH